MVHQGGMACGGRVMQMGGNNSPNNRFPLPDNWTVTEFICAVVPVPNDEQYISMLRGLLDTLTWSRSFQHHPTENAAREVADTWLAAFNSHDISFQNCEAPMMILRQNPDNACQLQQSQDGGDTWSLAFDYSLCANNITVPAPYPGSETGASDAAAAAVRNIFEKLVQLVDCGAGRDAYINAATAYMRTYDAGYANPAALGAIFDAYCADPDAGDDYKTDCPYDDHKSDIQGCTNSDGLMDWLNCLSDTIINWLNTSSGALMDALNQAAAALSGNGWQRAGGGGAGGGAGFGFGCGLWHQIWDFTIDEQGWAGYTGATTYAAGEGWQSSSGSDLQIYIAGPTRTVRYQKIVFSDPSDPTTRLVWLNYDTSNGYDQSGVSGVLEWTSGDLANMTFYGGLFTGGQVAVGHTWAGVKVIRVEEWGEGVNPWI